MWASGAAGSRHWKWPIRKVLLSLLDCLVLFGLGSVWSGLHLASLATGSKAPIRPPPAKQRPEGAAPQPPAGWAPSPGRPWGEAPGVGDPRLGTASPGEAGFAILARGGTGLLLSPVSRQSLDNGGQRGPQPSQGRLFRTLPPAAASPSLRIATLLRPLAQLRREPQRRARPRPSPAAHLLVTRSLHCPLGPTRLSVRDDNGTTYLWRHLLGASGRACPRALLVSHSRCKWPLSFEAQGRAAGWRGRHMTQV